MTSAPKAGKLRLYGGTKSAGIPTGKRKQMRSAVVEFPLLRTKIRKPFRNSLPPAHTHIATYRCRSDLLPPTLVPAVPASTMDYNIEMPRGAGAFD